MSTNAALLKTFRQVHLYFGLFITPALIFFAFTGAFQTLGLHEASANYKPSALLATLGQIHKKQTWMLPVHRAPGGEGARPSADGARPDAARPGSDHSDTGRSPAAAAALPSAPQQPPTLQAKQKQHLPMKIFFVLVSLGLLTSSVTGIYMAYKYDRNKVLVTGLLLAGAILPLFLVRF